MCLDTLWIDPIDKCSLNCIMCRFKSKHGNANSISRRDFCDLLTQGRQLGVDNLFLGITAEPTQYGDLNCLLKESKESGFKRIGMFTNFNAASLKKDLLVSLSMINDIGISIDAASKRTYEYIRRGASWDLLVANLNNFGKYWKGNRVEARFTVQKSNIPEISMFIDFVRKFKFFTAIVFEPVNSSFIGYSNRKLSEWDYDDLLLCEKELSLGYNKAKEYGIECKEYIKVAAMANNKKTLLDKGYMPFMKRFVQDLYDKRFPLSNPCVLPSHALYISPAREAYLCECAYGANEFKLGDLNTQNLKMIWESATARQLRKQLAEGIRLNLCKNHCYCLDGQMDIKTIIG